MKVPRDLSGEELACVLECNNRRSDPNILTY